jgi:CheY-like chemotaxis protein
MTYDQGFEDNEHQIERLLNENKALKEKLVKAENRAEESDKLKNAFLANMSHEIRTPMNAILGFAELLSDDHLTASIRDEYVSIICENGKALLTILDDIMDTAKIESEQIEIQKSDCNINELLKELQEQFNDSVVRDPDKILDLKLTIPANLQKLQIKTDSYRLKQVLFNLISNAIKFTSKGYVEFGFVLLQEKEQIQFFVKDTGVGISDEDKEYIFNRFNQVMTDGYKSRRGAGLGLAICKSLAELLEGDLSFESSRGKGSEFYLTLPFEASEFIEQVEEKKGLSAGYHWQDKHIMIVEDEESNYRYLKYSLEITGVNLIRAHNGMQAIEMFKKESKIDLILMDIHLPVMNGYDATQMIKEINPDVPVIAQTAFAMPGEKEKSKEAGCDGYLSKPIARKAMLQMIDDFFASRKE